MSLENLKEGSLVVAHPDLLNILGYVKLISPDMQSWVSMGPNDVGIVVLPSIDCSPTSWVRIMVKGSLCECQIRDVKTI